MLGFFKTGKDLEQQETNQEVIAREFKRRGMVIFPAITIGYGMFYVCRMTMSVVKKPEILAVVLDPPEASPGQSVTASFLMADERGPVVGTANLWMPMVDEQEVGNDPLAFAQALNDMGLSIDDLAGDRLEFVVGPAESYRFDEEGRYVGDD